MCNLINIHTHRMTKITGLDFAVMCNLINTHTHTPLGGSLRMAWNDCDDSAGLRGYVRFNKYTYTHTQQALSFRMQDHLCRQGVARAGTRQLRSQGPVSVHAHCTEGVTGS